MAAIATPVLTQASQLRPLNIVRDLPAVANLVEKCFADTMDAEGRNYIQQMRRAGQDNAFLRWASTAVDTVSMPLSGYVWEEHGEIIGNVSLIPYRHSGKKYYLIANVSVLPDERRRGIGRSLTIAAMQHARRRHVDETWLHVRADNPGAIKLYSSLGFIEMARRTNWQATPDQNIDSDIRETLITSRKLRDWPSQKDWLQRLYPDLLTWYQPMPWVSLRPGLGPTLYRILSDINIRHWVARTGDTCKAVLSWQAASAKNDCLWAAVPPDGGDRDLTVLLLHARRVLVWRQKLILDFPSGQYNAPIEASGFQAHRTLLWMKSNDASNETLVDIKRKSS
jgi:ribosomal protein S18 acetylase RimI-like enzyme